MILNSLMDIVNSNEASFFDRIFGTIYLIKENYFTKK